MRKSVCSSILLTWPSATSFITETPKASRIGFFFTATRWHGEPVNQEPHNCAGLHRADLARPPANTAPSTAAALTAMIHGAAFSLDGRQRQRPDPPPLDRSPLVEPSGFVII
jgi:hypothetical protein